MNARWIFRLNQWTKTPPGSLVLLGVLVGIPILACLLVVALLGVAVTFLAQGPALQIIAALSVIVYLVYGVVIMPFFRDRRISDDLKSRGYSSLSPGQLLSLRQRFNQASWDAEAKYYELPGQSAPAIPYEEQYSEGPKPLKLEAAIGQLPTADEARLLPLWDEGSEVDSILRLVKLRAGLLSPTDRC